MTLIGLPSTLPPKSSTAICAAVTEPCPVGVEAGPFMSLRTPILTTLSEISACAAVVTSSAAAAHAASLKELSCNPSSKYRHDAVVFLGSAGRSAYLQSIHVGRQSRRVGRSCALQRCGRPGRMRRCLLGLSG